jgi:hypothetical protein
MTSPQAHATTPSLFWNGVSKLQVRCFVQSVDGAEIAGVEQALCNRVRDLAGTGASLPVRLVDQGDRALVDPAAVTLLVHASIQPGPAGRTMTLAIRPHRSSEPSEILFGARPRAVTIGSAGAAGNFADAAISAALSELLPWQERPEGPRPISR